MRHFHEKLREEPGIHLSYTWMKQALQGAGLVARRKKRGSHRRRRLRRPKPSIAAHRWEQALLFSDDRYYDLLVFSDDTTSEIYYAQLVGGIHPHGDERIAEVIESKGLFCALYSDRGKPMHSCENTIWPSSSETCLTGRGERNGFPEVRTQGSEPGVFGAH